MHTKQETQDVPDRFYLFIDGNYMKLSENLEYTQNFALPTGGPEITPQRPDPSQLAATGGAPGVHHRRRPLGMTVFDDFSPEIWIYAAMTPIDYFLTTPNQFALRLGSYHLRRLKLLRGDQVDFYQWENRKGLKWRTVVD